MNNERSGKVCSNALTLTAMEFNGRAMVIIAPEDRAINIRQPICTENPANIILLRLPNKICWVWVSQTTYQSCWRDNFDT